MNFAADIGNSSSKLGLFEGATLQEVISDLTTDELIKELNDHRSGRVIVASVAADPVRVISRLSPQLDSLALDHAMKLPISIKYRTPETLGVDRIAAVTGAYSLSPGNNCLVIDIGTCITYDYLDAKGNYWGGAISPGIKLRAKALNNYTAKLPMIDLDFGTELIGRSTIESISSGVMHGTVGEIDSMIKRFEHKVDSDLKIYMCGGDAKLFESKVKATIFVVPELVLLGLNTILLWNEKD